MDKSDKDNKDNKVALRLTDTEVVQLNKLVSSARSNKQEVIRALVRAAESASIINGEYVFTFKEGNRTK